MAFSARSPCSSAELHVDLWEAAAPSRQAEGRDMYRQTASQSVRRTRRRGQERARELLARLGVLDHAVARLASPQVPAIHSSHNCSPCSHGVAPGWGRPYGRRRLRPRSGSRWAAQGHEERRQAQRADAARDRGGLRHAVPGLGGGRPVGHVVLQRESDALPDASQSSCQGSWCPCGCRWRR